MKIKDIVVIGVLSALLVAVQLSLSFLPNIELVSLLILIFTLIFKSKTLYIIYIFTFIEGMIFGFSLWWFTYLYVWTILFLIVLLFKNNKSSYVWAIILGFYGLSFGALCSIPFLFITGLPTTIARWISGIPFDLAHGLGNFVITLVLFQPLYKILKHIKTYLYPI